MGQYSELHIQIQDEMLNAIHKVEQGNLPVLDALIQLEEERKNLETSLAIIKSFKAEQLENIADEAINYKDGFKGFKIEVRSGGRMYNFKNIEEWKTYQKNLKDCEERYKQAFILKEKGLMVASEDGEEMELPEISYRKSSVIVSHLKH